MLKRSDALIQITLPYSVNSSVDMLAFHKNFKKLRLCLGDLLLFTSGPKNGRREFLRITSVDDLYFRVSRGYGRLTAKSFKAGSIVTLVSRPSGAYA